ncbi:platelet-activating factor acetylhydrolase IB subunit alpha2-like isoform X1 [Daktulosphaira vitifoliae]|uniref:platelet-activating factor acetylhydrolase IB subunit alpha2-like isoform X1 n=1 Tax=Daktulosphaira vitifoliae TaxID=58002 RepID=UPI0021AAA1A8|nr:platelet-activating factor acetylhydrolase IB subunit alpha2-like isoform X1 [Daktulosphaira vitifoliae]
MNPCNIPSVPIIEEEKWRLQHKIHITKANSSDPDVLLIGASIIEFIQYHPIWKEKFIPLNSVNFGIAGDCTQNVLWRVKNGILDNIKPKVCILNVGSNNLENLPEDVVSGILAIVYEIKLKIPKCFIIIIGILPRGPRPNNLREIGTQINTILSQNIKSISQVELFIPNLLQEDGILSEKDAPDFLHPSESGYQKIFNPILPRVSAILNN